MNQESWWINTCHDTLLRCKASHSVLFYVLDLCVRFETKTPYVVTQGIVERLARATETRNPTVGSPRKWSATRKRFTIQTTGRD